MHWVALGYIDIWLLRYSMKLTIAFLDSFHHCFLFWFLIFWKIKMSSLNISVFPHRTYFYVYVYSLPSTVFLTILLNMERVEEDNSPIILLYKTILFYNKNTFYCFIFQFGNFMKRYIISLRNVKSKDVLMLSVVISSYIL